jgi:CheY-like chemotaxis protein
MNTFMHPAFRDARPDDRADNPSPRTLTVRTAPSMASPTVLLVDDDSVVRAIFADAFRLAGFRVVEATNGREALAQLWRGRFDLIVADLFMPEMDGLELLRTLQRQRSSTPVIAVSAGGELEQLQMLDLARALGAARVLEKPVAIADLIGAARELVPEDSPSAG